MRYYNRQNVFRRFLLGVFFITLVSEVVNAAPFARWLTVPLDDGRTIRIWGEGDEYSAHFESEDGRAVVYDESLRAYTYARKDLQTGALVSTKIKVGEESLHKQRILELPKYERDTSSQYRDNRERRIREKDEIMQTSRRWRTLKERRRRQLRKEGETVTNVLSAAMVQPSPPTHETTGEVVGLALLIDFPGEIGTSGTLASQIHPNVTKSDIENLFNAESFSKYGNACSVRKYYDDISCGNISYTNIVLGWFLMPHPRSYYDDTLKKCGECAKPLIAEVFRQIRNDPEYSLKYEPLLRKLTLGDYSAPVAVNVYFAGESSTRWDYGLWAHASSFGGAYWGEAFYEIDGTRYNIYRYQISPVTASPYIATVCHESAHMAFDFPDLYHYGAGRDGNSEGNGVGKFCLMSSSTSDTNPQAINPYLRAAAGWIIPKELSSAHGKRSVTCSLADVWKWTNPDNPQEYYLIENRRKRGHDAGLPGEGILIWRCNEDGDNTSAEFLSAFAGTLASGRRSNELSLEQADGLYSIERKENYGDVQDPWYSENRLNNYESRFDDASIPCAKWADASDSGLCLTGFSDVGDTMEFYVGEAPFVSIVFDPAGGELENRLRRAVAGAKYGDLPVPVRRGYAFSGWKDSSGRIVAGTDSVSSSRCVLTAAWSVKTQADYSNVSFGKGKSGWLSEVFLSSVNASSPKISFAEGEQIQFYVGYENSGSRSTPGAFEIKMNVFNEDWLPVWQIVFNEGSVLTANSGIRYWGGANISGPNLQKGRYVFRVELDASRDIEEYDEADNVREIAFSIGADIPSQCSVAFNANGGTGGMPAVTATAGMPMMLTACSFARTGHDFAGWSTSRSGYASYADGDRARFFSDVILYAVWSPRPYRVSFDGCGGSGVAGDISVLYGETLPEIPSPTFPGYDFVGWFTAKSGGKQFTQTDIITGDTTLYARWRKSFLTLSVDAADVLVLTGGASDWFGQSLTSHDDIDAAQSGAVSDYEESWMQAEVSGPAVVSFRWKVSSEERYDKLKFFVDGEPISEVADISGEVDWRQEVVSIGSGTHTLKWTYSKDGSRATGSDCGWVDQLSVVPNAYIVRFNKNDGTGVVSSQTLRLNVSQGLSWVDSQLRWTRPGYAFLGWATSADGLVVYANGQSVKNLSTTHGAVVNLYARWRANTYTVRFHKGAGTTTSASQMHTVGRSQNLTWMGSGIGWSVSGCSFAGWATSASGPVVYANGQSVTNLSTVQGAVVNLYAVWTYTVTLRRNAGSGDATSSRVTMRYGSGASLPWFDSGLKWTRTGYMFVGWSTGASAAASYANGLTVTNLINTAGTLYAQYRPNTYAVQFHRNRSSSDATVQNQSFTYDREHELRWLTNGLKWDNPGCTFLGWATNATSTTISYSNGQRVKNLTAANGAVVHLYAVWSSVLGSALDVDGRAIVTGGNEPWYMQSVVKYFGAGAAQSGDILHNESSWMKTTVEGPANVSFWWKVSSESNWDKLRFYVDDVEQDCISGEVDWTKVSVTLGSGTHTLKWVYSKDGSVDRGSDCGWVDQLSIGAPSYTICFHKNDGSGTVVTRSFAAGKNHALPWINSGLGWTNPSGCSIVGWSRSSTVTSKTWSNGQTVKDLASAGGVIDLYLVWTPRPYTIRFHKNDGSGTVVTRSFASGKNHALPWINGGFGWTNPSGCSIVGWSRSSSATSKTWSNGQTVKDLASAGSSVDLYVVWSRPARSSAVLAAPSVQAESASSIGPSANPKPELLSGYYCGELADGTGMYNLLVDEGGETGYVNIVFDDGSVLTDEVDVDILGDIILVTDEDGEMYQLKL